MVRSEADYCQAGWNSDTIVRRGRRELFIMPKKNESTAKNPTETNAKATPTKPVVAKSKPAAPAAEPAVAKSPAKVPAVAGKAPAKNSGKSKPTQGNVGGLIDSSLLASSAANLLLARRKGQLGSGDAVSVDYLRNQMNRPAAAVVESVLEKHAADSGKPSSELPVAKKMPRAF